MCSIDWLALGTWIGSAGIVAAAVIAQLQLTRFNDNERVQNTLQYVDHFAHVSFQYGESAFTVANASTIVVVGSSQIERLQRGLEYLNGLDSDDDSAAKEARDHYFRVSNAASVVNNYYFGAYTLIKRQLLDRDLFFENFALDMNKVWNATTKVFEVDGRTTFKFKLLNDMAQIYLAREIDKQDAANKPPVVEIE
jgi:hypothetical protein